MTLCQDLYMTPHMLLITNAQGSIDAVRFPSADAARDWEDANSHRLGEVVGCVPVSTKREVLR